MPISPLVPPIDPTAYHHQDHLERSFECPNSMDVLKDVQPGYAITVKGNLVVHGSIRGSELVVTRDLFVVGGIFGEAGRKIVVHGKVQAGHISNAHIECDKSVEVMDSVINSVIRARDSVTAGENIMGGEVLSMASIAAGRIGSDKGVETRVGAGIDFKLKIMFDEMNAEIAEITEKAEKIKLGILALENKDKTHYGGITYQDKQLIKSSRASLDKLEKQLEGLNSRKRKFELKLEKVIGSFVEVRDKIFPGSTLSIQNRFVAAQKEYPAGRYTIKNDKIFRLQENKA